MYGAACESGKASAAAGAFGIQLRYTSFEPVTLLENHRGSEKRVLGYDVGSYLVSGARKEHTFLQGRAFIKEVPSD